MVFLCIYIITSTKTICWKRLLSSTQTRDRSHNHGSLWPREWTQWTRTRAQIQLLVKPTIVPIVDYVSSAPCPHLGIRAPIVILKPNDPVRVIVDLMILIFIHLNPSLANSKAQICQPEFCNTRLWNFKRARCGELGLSLN